MVNEMVKRAQMVKWQGKIPVFLNQAVEAIESLLPDALQMTVLKCQEELFLLRR